MVRGGSVVVVAEEATALFLPGGAVAALLAGVVATRTVETLAVEAFAMAAVIGVITTAEASATTTTISRIDLFTIAAH